MIRFAAIADVQYGDLDETIGRAYRESIQKFLICAGEISRMQPLFAMNFGDSWQSGLENALAMKELYEVAAKYGKIEWRHILGNHDFHVPDANKPDVYRFLNLEKPGYYDFQVVDEEDAENRWRFVVLNGNEISTYAAENDEERKAAKEERERRRIPVKNNALPDSYNGSLSPRQLQWLDERLAFAEKEKENAIVCSHFPLFAKSRSIDSDRAKLARIANFDVYYYNLGVSTWNGAELLEIIDRHPNVRGYFAGHLHEGSYGVRNNVAHVTFKGIVENKPYCWAAVELTKSEIIVTGYGAQPSYRLRFL